MTGLQAADRDLLVVLANALDEAIYRGVTVGAVARRMGGRASDRGTAARIRRLQDSGYVRTDGSDPSRVVLTAPGRAVAEGEVFRRRPECVPAWFVFILFSFIFVMLFGERDRRKALEERVENLEAVRRKP